MSVVYYDIVGEEPVSLAGDAGAPGDGKKIPGIDGVLEQVSAALVKQAAKDPQLHQNVGTAIGAGFAREAAPWLALGAGALTVIAVVYVATHTGRTTRKR